MSWSKLASVQSFMKLESQEVDILGILLWVEELTTDILEDTECFLLGFPNLKSNWAALGCPNVPMIKISAFLD